MRLPAPLVPWARQLGIFPPDVASALGPLVRRLAAAVGELAPRHEGDDGEPDGFDGLDHRGSYERLLASEWLLADEFPEEFLRRAGAREHTFLRLARPDPAVHRHTVVLLDAGPSQLGTPRIAHLAALVVLARRADAAGAGFSWGVLQARPASSETGLAADSLHRWLDARSSLEATEAQLRAWREHAAGRWHTDDLWLVGGRRWRTSAPTQGMFVLSVRDLIEPLTRRLSVVVQGPRRSTIEVLLDLPDDPVCTRLVRNPTGLGPPNTETSRLGVSPGELLFSSNGSRLLARTADGDLIAYVVPGSPNEPLASPVWIRRGSRRLPIAAEHTGRRVLVALSEPGGIEIEEYSKKGHRLGSRSYRWWGVAGDMTPASQPPPFGSLVPLGDDLYLLHPAGHICRLSRKVKAVATVVAEAVAAFGSTRSGLAYVERARPPGSWRAVIVDGKRRPPLPLVDAPRIEAHLGFRSVGEHGVELVAVSAEDGKFRLWSAQGWQEVSTLGGRALGVCANQSLGPALVVAGSKLGGFACIGTHRTRKLVELVGAVRAVAFTPATQNIACLTADGELAVLSVPHNAILGRWLQGLPDPRVRSGEPA